MAQYLGTIKGSRKRITGVGGKSSGLKTTCEGYNKGVIVIATYEDGKDVFKIYETDGTNSDNKKLITIIEE